MGNLPGVVQRARKARRQPSRAGSSGGSALLPAVPSRPALLAEVSDLYDRRQIGLVLIGMPGLHKRLARYAQLYSRVGFVDQFQPLSGREFQHGVDRQWVQLGLEAASDVAIEANVVNAIARVTGGNFRLIERLFAQIERVLTINKLHIVTTAVVDATRESLVVSAL